MNGRSFRMITTTCALGATALGLVACTSSSSDSSRTSTPASSTPAAAASSVVTPASEAVAGGSATSGAAPSGPTTAPSGFHPTSASFISANEGWALGAGTCPSEPCASIVRTRDGGKSWQLVPAPKTSLTKSAKPGAASVSMLRFADAENGFAAGGGMFTTHNGGASWNQPAVGPAGSSIAAVATGGGYVFAVVNLCSPDKCTRPTQVWASPIGSDTFAAMSQPLTETIMSSGFAVHGADWFALTSSGGAIYHGHGAAAPTGRPGPCPVDTGSAALAVADTSHLDALCSGNPGAGSATAQLYGTSDGGSHWLKNGTAQSVETSVSAVADNGAGALLVAASSGSSRLYRTTNERQSLPTVLDVNSGGTAWTDAGFTTGTQALAVLGGKALYLSHNGGASWSKASF